MIDLTNAKTVRNLANLAAFVESLAEVGADVYANARFRARPIVDRHFTPGNQERYGWPSLSEKYAEAKRGQLKSLRAGMKSAGRTVSRLDEDQFGGSILPMLVRTGALRQAVASKTHRITRQGDVAIIVFDNLPQYAIYHHTGTANLPKRSPVEPNDIDTDEVAAEMQKRLDVVLKAADAQGSVRIGD